MHQQQGKHGQFGSEAAWSSDDFEAPEVRNLPASVSFAHGDGLCQWTLAQWRRLRWTHGGCRKQTWSPADISFYNIIISGWWFGTWLLFSHILGIIIPTDELIFFRGVETTNQIYIYIWNIIRLYKYNITYIIYIIHTYVICHICNIHRDLIAISRRVAKAWVQHTHKGSLFSRGKWYSEHQKPVWAKGIPKSSDCSVNHIFFLQKLPFGGMSHFQTDTSISSWLHSPLYYIILSPLLSHYPILHQGAPLSQYIILHPHDTLLNYTKLT